MKKNIKAIGLSFLFMGLSFNAFSSNNDNEIKDFVNISRSLFPETLTAQNVADLKAHRKFGMVWREVFLDEENAKKFDAAQPSRLQVLTGGNAGFAVRVVPIEEKERKINDYTLARTYEYKSCYTNINNQKFDLFMKIIPFNVFDSVLGDRDFLASKSKPTLDYTPTISNSSFFYLRNTDESFIRETNAAVRLNGNLTTYLLMRAQLIEKVDVYSLSDEKRKEYGKKIFDQFVTKHGLKKDDEGALPLDEYVKHILRIRDELLAYHHLTVDMLPHSDDVLPDDYQVGKHMVKVPLK